jgi:hypothetical protein
MILWWWWRFVSSLFFLRIYQDIYSLPSFLMHNFSSPSFSPSHCPLTHFLLLPLCHITSILSLCFPIPLTLSHLMSFLTSPCILFRFLYFLYPHRLSFPIVSAKTENSLQFPCVLTTVHWVYAKHGRKWLLVTCRLLFSSVQIHPQILCKHMS